MAKINDGEESRQHRIPPGKVNLSLETGVDLPSYGMSAFLNISSGEDVKKLLNSISRGDKVIKPSPLSAVIQQPTHTDSISVAASAAGINTSMTDNDHPHDGDEMPGKDSNSTIMADNSLQQDETEGEVVICLSQPGTNVADLQDQSIYGPLAFTAGRTQPLGVSTTSETSDVEYSLENEISENELFGEGAENMMSEELPTIELKVAGYSRFRYQSERNPANKRTRQYDMDEDKRCLAEVEVKNYSGPAKVIAYCVNGHGQLHPYNLFGTNCNKGVFVKRVDFSRKQPVIKLLKVSITTPKAKEYINSVKQQRAYLEEMNVITEKEVALKSGDSGDKQVVYLMVKVILEDSHYTTLCKQSKEIRNKKEGTEFKIRSVIPPCAPIAGPCDGNPDKNKVCVIVTDNTAFPKDVCVVLKKECDGVVQWMRVLKSSQIEVIRRSVVEFSPPPFRQPDLPEDVEVQLLLRDLKTHQETEPVTFTYKGIDEYGVMGKGQKRKLVDTMDSLIAPGKNLQADRKTLRAIRKVAGKDCSLEDVSEQDEKNSLTVVEEMSTSSACGHYSQTQVGPDQEIEISIGQMRQNRQPSQVIDTVTTLSNQPKGFMKNTLTAQPASLMLKNEQFSPQVSQSTSPNFSDYQMPTVNSQRNVSASLSSSQAEALLNQLLTTSQNLSSESVPQSVPQPSEGAIDLGLLLKLAEAKRQGQDLTPVQKLLPTMQQPPPPQPVIDPAISSQLPKLKPNQMFAVIKGQIVIINDDRKEIPAVQKTMVDTIGVQRMLAQQSCTESNNMTVYPQSATQIATGNALYIPNVSQMTQNNESQSAHANSLNQNQVIHQQTPREHQTMTPQQQLRNQIINDQTVPWHMYNRGLEDDDLEIDSASQHETDNGKLNLKRPKTNNLVISSDNGSYQNLPKIITDTCEDSEKKEINEQVVYWQGDNVLVLVSGSEDEAEEMKS